MAETQALENPWDVRLKGLRVRIPLPHSRVQLRRAVRAARQESVVPDVEGLEPASEAGLDEARDASQQRRGEHGLEDGAGARLGNLAVLVEAARDVRGRRWRVGVHLAHGAERGQERGVAGVRLAFGAGRSSLGRWVVRVLDAGGAHFVGRRIPVDRRVVDDGRRDRLRHDAFHDFLQQPLARQALLAIRVVGLDLIAQVPVR